MRHARWLLLAGASLAAFAAGGSWTNADDTAPTPVSFCSIVTLADAQAALGGSPRKTDSGQACTYTVINGSQLRSLTVMASDEALTADNFDDAMRVYADKAEAPLRRLNAGDESWAVMTAPASQAVGRKGDHFLSVTLIDTSSTIEDRATRLTGVLGTALSRYGS